jgi:hypothetical protein
VDDLIAVGDPEFLDLVHDKMGSLVGDGGGRVKPLSIQVQLTPQHGIYVYT